MSQTRPEPEGVQLALQEIAEARQHLQLANDALSAFGYTGSRGRSAARRRCASRGRLEIEAPPPNLLDIAL